MVTVPFRVVLALESDTLTPFLNAVPLIANRTVSELYPTDGLMAETVGDAFVTLNTCSRVTFSPLGFVTVRLYTHWGDPVRGNVHLIKVLLENETVPGITRDEFVRLTTTPVLIPVPVMLAERTAVFGAEDGVMDSMVKLDAFS